MRQPGDDRQGKRHSGLHLPGVRVVGLSILPAKVVVAVVGDVVGVELEDPLLALVAFT